MPSDIYSACLYNLLIPNNIGANTQKTVVGIVLCPTACGTENTIPLLRNEEIILYLIYAAKKKALCPVTYF
jgi:hypothetical protein